MAAKLHQLIAVEPDASARSTKIIQETKTDKFPAQTQ